MDWKIKIIAGSFLLGLAACGSDSSSNADGGSVGSSGGELAEKYAIVVDETQQIITQYEPTCEKVNGVAVFNPVGDTSTIFYRIQNDTLCLSPHSDDFDCEDVICLVGDNAGSIFGEWRYPESENLPGVAAWRKISDSQMEEYVDYSQVCLAKWLISIDEKRNEDYQYTFTDCAHYSITSTIGTQTVRRDYTVSMSVAKDESSYTVYSEDPSLNGLSCTGMTVFQPLSKDNCTLENLEGRYVKTDYHRMFDEGDACGIFKELDN